MSSKMREVIAPARKEHLAQSMINMHDLLSVSLATVQCLAQSEGSENAQGAEAAPYLTDQLSLIMSTQA